MKKKLIIVPIAALLLLSSCGTSVSQTATEETQTSITNGDYDAAYYYSEMAVKYGASDEDFVKLNALLKNYCDAADALDELDLETAADILGNIEDFDSSGMTGAITALNTTLSAQQMIAESYDRTLDDIEAEIDDELYNIAMTELKDLLLSEDIPKAQRERAHALYDEAETGMSLAAAATPVPTPTPVPTTLTKEQAWAAVQAEYNVPADAMHSITDMGSYYQIGYEYFMDMDIYDDEPFKEEGGCKVDKTTGRVYDQVG